jgi:hypothetical protein
MKEFLVLGRGKGAELGASVGIEIEGAFFCPIHDHRGNITTLVDTVTQQVYETYRYSAFGEEHVNSPLVLIDPYELTALEDAVDVGMEAGMGLG